jgi:hypothetical protein
VGRIDVSAPLAGGGAACGDVVAEALEVALTWQSRNPAFSPIFSSTPSGTASSWSETWVFSSLSR